MRPNKCIKRAKNLDLSNCKKYSRTQFHSRSGEGVGLGGLGMQMKREGRVKRIYTPCAWRDTGPLGTERSRKGGRTTINWRWLQALNKIRGEVRQLRSVRKKEGFSSRENRLLLKLEVNTALGVSFDTRQTPSYSLGRRKKNWIRGKRKTKIKKGDTKNRGLGETCQKKKARGESCLTTTTTGWRGGSNPGLTEEPGLFGKLGSWGVRESYERGDFMLFRGSKRKNGGGGGGGGGGGVSVGQKRSVF